MSTITHDIEQIKKHLQAGEIAAIPTETVYGLAGNALNEQAIKKIYALKNRPSNHPIIMHVSTSSDLLQWVRNIPDYAALLIKKFWPGPLTLVFNQREHEVSPLITGGQSTIALRSPNHPLTQQLLQQLNFPLVAPSANPFGKISPTTAEHVQQSFADSELLILDGGRCPVGIESTIVDATNSLGYKILREGGIDAHTIANLLPNRQIASANTIRISGNLKTHYQPQKKLYCFEDLRIMQNYCQKHNNAFVFSFKHWQQKVLSSYLLPKDAGQLAYELYYQLRQADSSTADYIAFELPPKTSAWAGIRERLLKAGKLIID